MNIYQAYILLLGRKLGWKIIVGKNAIRINGVFFYRYWHYIKPEKYYNPMRHAPKSYTHVYWGYHRAKERQEIHRELSGKEPHYPYNHRKSKTWEYW